MNEEPGERSLGSSFLKNMGSTSQVAERNPHIGPFIVDGFLSHEECKKLLSLWVPDPSRKSRTIYKEADDCIINPVEVASRISRFTESIFKESKIEPIKFIRYGVGDFFSRHIDWVDGQRSPRIATIMIYLSPCIGGETFFPYQEEMVTPAAGRLCWFYNVLNDVEQYASLHESLPVKSGEKNVIVTWIYRPKPG